MDLGLKGKVALVTGGSRGIGKAIAMELAREGALVAIAARDRAVLDQAAADIAAGTGGTAKAYVTDTGEDEAVKQLVAAVARDFGRIDILVNCAAQPGGQARPPSLAEITYEAFLEDMNVKVMGYLRTCREVAPIMAAKGGGRIINISGGAARRTGSAIGSMRNISVAALTKNIADELGPKNIQAVCVHPGTTRTEKTAGVIAARARAQGITPAEVERKMAGGNVVNRLLGAEDIAYLVAFLASPRGIAVNGDTIAAGGGVPGAIYY